MNKIASTLCGWNEIVEKFIAADLDASRGDYEKMQVFVNTNLGLPWEEPGETVETTALIDRREFYEAEVPDGVLYLTCGIDTQDDRFEAEVVGWGVGKESWGIRYQRIYGDLKRGQVWADLDAFLSTTWKKRDRTELSIRAACMDSGGHFPDQVIRFCKEREDRHIWAIKGRGGMDVPYIRNPTKNNRVGGELFVLGVDTGKNAVLARLKVLIKGPNYCHFPAGQDAGYDENYFKMLTAEHKVTHWKGGRKVERWELKDPAQKRNEAFDARNYATAALEISNPPGWKSRARVRRVRQNRSTSTAEEDRENLTDVDHIKRIAKQHLEMWLKAEEAVSTGQRYQIEQMQLTRASLKQIRESISFWEGKVAEAEREEQGRGRNRIYHFAPHDV